MRHVTAATGYPACSPEMFAMGMSAETGSDCLPHRNAGPMADFRPSMAMLTPRLHPYNAFPAVPTSKRRTCFDDSAFPVFNVADEPGYFGNVQMREASFDVCSAFDKDVSTTSDQHQQPQQQLAAATNSDVPSFIWNQRDFQLTPSSSVFGFSTSMTPQSIADLDSVGRRCLAPSDFYQSSAAASASAAAAAGARQIDHHRLSNPGPPVASNYFRHPCVTSPPCVVDVIQPCCLSPPVSYDGIYFIALRFSVLLRDNFLSHHACRSA